MNSWNFNEVTQQDILDYKACQRQDGSIYGVPDKSECQKGKEIKKEDLVELSKKANAGDKKARAQIEQYQKVQKEQQAKAKAEKEAAKKKAAAEGDKKKKGKGGGKKGGGKGKKGGGKGKGGKGKGGAAKGGGSSAQMRANAKATQQKAQQARNKRAQEIRSRISDLQKTLRSIKNPEVRKALEEQISLALKSVSALQQGQSVGTGSPGDVAKAPQTPPATNEKV